jgi:hypothetical protein
MKAVKAFRKNAVRRRENIDNDETTFAKIKLKPYSKKDIDRVSREPLVTLVLGRRVRRRVNSRRDKTDKSDDISADGSAKSIFEWSKRLKQAVDDNEPPIFDKDQMRAFHQVILRIG